MTAETCRFCAALVAADHLGVRGASMGSWSIGSRVATTDPSIPPNVQGDDQPAQFTGPSGQGKVTATPLFMPRGVWRR